MIDVFYKLFENDALENGLIQSTNELAKVPNRLAVLRNDLENFRGQRFTRHCIGFGYYGRSEKTEFF